jgi:hypothetical protein
MNPEFLDADICFALNPNGNIFGTEDVTAVLVHQKVKVLQKEGKTLNEAIDEVTSTVAARCKHTVSMIRARVSTLNFKRSEGVI